MADWTDAPLTATVARLTDVPLALREAVKAGAKDHATHAAQFDALPALREIELGGVPPRRASVPGAARVLFWNVERLRHLGAITETLRDASPDVLLLCEIDRGMARSGNTDRVADLAGRLGAGYAYAVEFVELDLGDVHEKRTHAGETNRDGLHGAAVLSDTALARPFLIRIERRGDWFDGSRDEPRVGGTIALGAQVDIAGTAITCVSVHLESRGDPVERAADMDRLITLVDAHAPGAPAILGGDFNTSTASYAERTADRAGWLAKLDAEPMRLLRPQLREPLFDLAQMRGYDWRACNVPDAPTTRHSAGSERRRSKIDWFFTRGLTTTDPRIIPAVRPDGTPSSDHEALIVTIKPG
jgi:endonuclease/exonuclease/phosphatase family metal-dependent hydrolase